MIICHGALMRRYRVTRPAACRRNWPQFLTAGYAAEKVSLMSS
jgi:hypothetical protein